jgi:AraC family transcriptional activator of tynA and feaB
MASIHRLSTATVPPLERLSFWNDACLGAYGAMVVDAEPDAFQGDLTSLHAGELQISSVMSTPAVCRRTASWARSGSDETVFSLHLVHSGRCRINHAGIENMALPGHMLIADRSKSYELAFAEPIQGLVLSLPWARFSGYVERLEALAGTSINVISGPGAVLSSFIRSCWDQLADCDEEQWPEAAADVIWELLESLLQDGIVQRAATGRAAAGLLHEARALIDNRFGDLGLTSSGVAAALGVSARYLQMVFAAVGTTPSRFLIARRLDAAAARLRHLDRSRGITDIALECGFNDLSYFSRAFRRRFGVSASAYRLSFGAKSADWR